jgi:OOP family OmpA-OmpF porin
MMKRLALICALTAPVIAGANEVGQWYVVPQIGGISVDNDRPLEDKDWLYGLSVGKHVSKALSIELNANGAQVGGGRGRGDLSLYGGSIDLLGVMNRAGTLAPYITAGVGFVQSEPEGASNATDAMAQAGVGLMWKAWQSADRTQSFSLRPEIKARWQEAGASGTLTDYIGTLGFQFAFGAAPAAAPTPVAAEPAPAPEPPPPPPAPPAPQDSDKDGVTDDVDRCPGTPAGVAVDDTGCPRKGSVTLEGVTFELNSARLTADSRTILDKVAADIKKYPRLRIELQGHTDSTGSDRYNLTLSQQRADAVRAYLLEQGVAPDQLVARGYGESQPIEDNSTEAGRAKNRRVVMSVLENPGDVEVEGEGSLER